MVYFWIIKFIPKLVYSRGLPTLQGLSSGLILWYLGTKVRSSLLNIDNFFWQVSHFKTNGWWVLSVDLSPNSSADANVTVDPENDWATQVKVQVQNKNAFCTPSSLFLRRSLSSQEWLTILVLKSSMPSSTWPVRTSIRLFQIIIKSIMQDFWLFSRGLGRRISQIRWPHQKFRPNVETIGLEFSHICLCCSPPSIGRWLCDSSRS